MAGSGRLRGSQRCGGVRGSRLAPGLAPAPVMQGAGLEIPDSEWELGVGGVAAPPYVVHEGFIPELAPLGWVTPPAGQASLGAPGCALCCSWSQRLAGSPAASSELPGLGHPCGPHLAGAAAGDWPDAVFRFMGRTWLAHLSPCLPGGVGEQLLLLPVAGVGQGGRP